MTTDQLRALLELLREFGVSDFSDGAVTLKLGGSFSVVNHPAAQPATAVLVQTPEQLEKANKTRELFNRLPPGYRDMFGIDV
jgi:hypothetical protein